MGDPFTAPVMLITLRPGSYARSFLRPASECLQELDQSALVAIAETRSAVVHRLRLQGRIGEFGGLQVAGTEVVPAVDNEVLALTEVQ